ncbi:hypothetical protein GF415_01605 [Candidatus Micrarchaeota archaeon]|nr:hypothetical protein [Candidatus Micrarchaeota archaeon]
MKIHEIMKSKEYKEAKDKIRDWKKQLDREGEEETLKIREEQRKFFSEMKKNNPEIYELFAVSRKEIGEKIYHNITGEEAIID